MVGIDLLDASGELARDLRDTLLQKAFYRGLLLLGCGRAAIRFCPPLVVTSEQIQVAVGILSEILEGIQ
jgi:4-aminobutyrate aminotransferase